VLDKLEKQMAVERSPLAISEKIRTLDKERAQQEKKLERIQSLFIEGEITAERRREVRQQVIDAMTVIAGKIETLRKREAAEQAASRGLDAAKSVLESLRDVADGATFAQKRKAVESLVDRIEVGADGRTKISFVFAPDSVRSAQGYASA
jgi:hypothetical protein